MHVPLLDLQAQFAPIRDEVLAAVERVCDSQRFVMGPEVDAFEQEIAALLRVKHAIGVSSGTDALLVSLMALGIGPGDEVVTSTYSFFATAGAVARVGATPVFVDIDPATFNIDVAQAARAITPRTRALMPVHLFGQMADMDAIADIARHGRHSRDRGRGAGDRRQLRRPTRRRHRRGGVLLVLPEQEPRRVRRRRARHHERRCPGSARAPAAQSTARSASITIA